MPTENHNVTLKEFINEKFSNLEKSTELARQSMEKRLDGMNEFRETLKDQASKFITRAEHDALIKSIDSDIRMLRESKAEIQGKANQSSVYVTYIISGIALLITLISTIIQFMKG